MLDELPTIDHGESFPRAVYQSVWLPANDYLDDEEASLPDLKSFRKTCPPFMTNLTRSSSVTSFEGSPETPIISAYLPFSMDPTRSPQPIFSAPTDVPERIACRGVIP